MRYAFICATAALVSTFSCNAEAVQRILNAELSISGISIGEAEESVYKRLGRPISRTDTGEGDKLKYPGMDVYVGSEGVYDLVSTRADRCTPSMICPGMHTSALLRAFGPAPKTKRETGIFLEYTPADSTCWLQVRERRGRISSIRIACQP